MKRLKLFFARLYYKKKHCIFFSISSNGTAQKHFLVHTCRDAASLIFCRYTFTKIKRSGKYLIFLFLTSSLFLLWCKEFWIITLLIVYTLGKSKHLIVLTCARIYQVSARQDVHCEKKSTSNANNWDSQSYRK